MKTSTVVALSVVITIIVSVLCIWWTPSKQDFTSTNVSWNGMSDWRDSVTHIGVNSIDGLPSLPEDRVILVIPNLPYRETELSQIRDFVSLGGTLVLVDDYGYGNDILSYFGVAVRFSNKTILDTLFCYKNLALPRITDFSPTMSKSGIKSIVLNHATSLSGVASTDVLAWSSKNSFLDSNDNGRNDAGESGGSLPVAARFTYDKGTIILFADPSIMINSMLNIEDNSAMVQYLTQSVAEHPYPVLLDQPHLEQKTLDKGKAALYTVREFLAIPYSLLGLVAIIFLVVYVYVFRKGELLG